MDWESIGGGGITGFVAAIATMLGWNRRLRNVEDSKQEKAVCGVTHAQVVAAQSQMQSDLTYIKARVDKLFDLMLNGSKH